MSVSAALKLPEAGAGHAHLVLVDHDNVPEGHDAIEWVGLRSQGRQVSNAHAASVRDRWEATHARMLLDVVLHRCTQDPHVLDAVRDECGRVGAIVTRCRRRGRWVAVLRRRAEEAGELAAQGLMNDRRDAGAAQLLGRDAGGGTAGACSTREAERQEAERQAAGGASP